MRLPVSHSPADLVRAFDQIGPIVMGKMVGPVAVATTSTKVAHGLGRVPIGFVEVSPADGSERVLNAAEPDATFLYLVADIATTVSRVWVF